ncbi:protein of unknown function [Bradyrhizobium vignae]|uniref:Uncharacterized protein n=1 Tax=Bradyrhizobium vignae TaxID=1549949 RepID=A0A2U3QAP2_9BRAD|nr:protein of unknown function [Bradyrhizobium vignae]
MRDGGPNVVYAGANAQHEAYNAFQHYWSHADGVHALGWRLLARHGCVNHAGIVDWTGGDTLRLVEMANTFSAFRRFNDKASSLFRDSNVRA